MDEFVLNTLKPYFTTHQLTLDDNSVALSKLGPL